MYQLDPENPGSDLAAEMSAALTSASIVFAEDDPAYSGQLLQAGREIFTFADTYRGIFLLKFLFVCFSFQ